MKQNKLLAQIKYAPKVHELKHDLTEVINIYIEDYELHPQETALVLIDLFEQSLSSLSWTPNEVKEALRKAREATNLLKH
jgi:hypothetical protein